MVPRVAKSTSDTNSPPPYLERSRNPAAIISAIADAASISSLKKTAIWSTASMPPRITTGPSTGRPTIHTSTPVTASEATPIRVSGRTPLRPIGMPSKSTTNPATARKISGRKGTNSASVISYSPCSPAVSSPGTAAISATRPAALSASGMAVATRSSTRSTVGAMRSKNGFG